MTTIEAGMPPDAPRLAPAIASAITSTGVVPDAVTAERGYGQASVDDALVELGVDLVAILRKGQPGTARQQVEPPTASSNSSGGAPAPRAESPR